MLGLRNELFYRENLRNSAFQKIQTFFFLFIHSKITPPLPVAIEEHFGEKDL